MQHLWNILTKVSLFRQGGDNFNMPIYSAEILHLVEYDYTLISSEFILVISIYRYLIFF